jgi:hypothetical protein
LEAIETIIRMGRGPVPKAKRQAYIDYLKRTGLADYAKTPGCRHVYPLCRDIGDQVEFPAMTMWDSIESVKGFAGEDHLKARCYPKTKAS